MWNPLQLPSSMKSPGQNRRVILVTFAALTGLGSVLWVQRERVFDSQVPIGAVAHAVSPLGLSESDPLRDLSQAQSVDRTADDARASGAKESSEIQLRTVLPDLDQVPADWRSFAPESIRVAVLPELVVTFTAQSYTPEGVRSVWTGSSAIAGGATLAAVGTRDSWTASVSFVDGNEYLVTVAGSRAFVSEFNPDLETCGNGLDPITEIAAETLPSAEAAAQADATAVSISDVLFLYDQATETAVKAELDRNGMTITAAERIDSVVRALIVQANEDLTRSGITDFRWAVTAVAAMLPYETNGDGSMSADLDAITFTNTEAGRYARELAVRNGADQTVLFVTGERDYAGLAWRPGHQAVCLWGTSHFVVAHEMGHNLDCNHDRETAGAADGGPYNFGHRYRAANGRDSGTIMSYAGTRVPYFSNPALTYQGTPLGVAAGQPKAADNARTIRENAAAMANYREAVTAPVITQQPAGATVVAGRTFSLAVTATGSNLSYQWFKDEVPISGATGSTYRKDGSTTSDAGSYTVTVSNPKRSVTSAQAVVAVSAGSSGGGSPPPAGGSGGGGGGGAPSVWFLLALATLAWLRGRQNRTTG